MDFSSRKLKILTFAKLVSSLILNVFRRMLVDKPSKKFEILFFEKNSPARSFCATTRYHPFPELGERDQNVFCVMAIVLSVTQNFVYCPFL